LEAQLEKLLIDSRSSVAAAIATLKSAALVVRDHTEQVRRAIEVQIWFSSTWQLLVYLCLRACTGNSLFFSERINIHHPSLAVFVTGGNKVNLYSTLS